MVAPPAGIVLRIGSFAMSCAALRRSFTLLRSLMLRGVVPFVIAPFFTRIFIRLIMLLSETTPKWLRISRTVGDFPFLNWNFSM